MIAYIAISVVVVAVLVVIAVVDRRWRARVEAARVQRERYRRWQDGIERLQRKAYVDNGRRLPESFAYLAGPEQRGLPIVEAMRAAWRERSREPARGGRIRGRR